MLDLTEKTLQSHEVYRGRIIRVRNDEVLLPNGEHGWREVVDHPGGVGILALTIRAGWPWCGSSAMLWASTCGRSLRESGRREKIPL